MLFLREFGRAWWKDWTGLMSGIASIVLTVWAVAFTPQAAKLKIGLWISAIVCLLLTTYRIWLDAHTKYLEEKTRNGNAQIHGEVKEVFFEKESEGGLASAFANTSQGLEYRGVHYDYTFNIRLYIANNRATTTIERFRVKLKSGNSTHESEKLAIEHLIVVRPTGTENVNDIEDLNDMPLDHGRKGWLRFVVHGVKGVGDYGKEPNQEIEIDVIDKNGIPHVISSIAQSAWKTNSRQSPEHVKAIYTVY
jgi:hypothetical protein